MTNYPQAPPAFALTRRQLAGGSLAGAAVLSVVGAGWRLFSAGRTTIDGLKVLSRPEADALDVLTTAFFPPGNGIGPDARDTELVRYIDGYIDQLANPQQTLVRSLITIFDQGTLASGYLRPVRKLDWVQAREYLASWEDSRLKWKHDLHSGLKSVVALAYFSHPDVLNQMTITANCPSAGPRLHKQAIS